LGASSNNNTQREWSSKRQESQLSPLNRELLNHADESPNEPMSSATTTQINADDRAAQLSPDADRKSQVRTHNSQLTHNPNMKIVSFNNQSNFNFNVAGGQDLVQTSSKGDAPSGQSLAHSQNLHSSDNQLEDSLTNGTNIINRSDLNK